MPLTIPQYSNAEIGFMDGSHEDLSSMSYDRTFGADRHDLRPHLGDLDGATRSFMDRAANAIRRLLGRATDASVGAQGGDWMQNRLSTPHRE